MDSPFRVTTCIRITSKSGVTWYGSMVTQTNCQNHYQSGSLSKSSNINQKKKEKLRSGIRVHVFLVSVDSPGFLVFPPSFSTFEYFPPLSWNESGWWWPVSARPAKKHRLKRISTPRPCHHCQLWRVWKGPKSLEKTAMKGTWSVQSVKVTKLSQQNPTKSPRINLKDLRVACY